MPYLRFTKERIPKPGATSPPDTPEQCAIVLELPTQAPPPPPPKARASAPRLKPYPHKSGYYDLAHRMAIADGEVAIFRHFRSLNLLNLLRLQAEITALELKIDEQRKEDSALDKKILSGTDAKGNPVWISSRECCSSFTVMREFRDKVKAQWGEGESSTSSSGSSNAAASRNSGDGTADPNLDGGNAGGASNEYSPTWGLQYDLIEEAGRKIKEYNEMLLQFRDLSKISKPDKDEMDALANWLAPEGTDIVSFFSWPETTYHKTPEQYISLQPEDSEANIIPDPLLRWYHKNVYTRLQARSKAQPSDDEKLAEIVTPGQTHYARKSLVRAGNWVIPVAASLLLIGSVIALYFIPTTLKRLFVTMPLTVVFSLLVSFLTSASRADVVAAVAAFVAVEVVFVGSVTPT